MAAWERANPDECVSTETEAAAVLGVNAEAALSARVRFFRVTALGEASVETRSPRGLLSRLLATAAERLMAVVVLPTPPFWLATVMIMNRRRFYRKK